MVFELFFNCVTVQPQELASIETEVLNIHILNWNILSLFLYEQSIGQV